MDGSFIGKCTCEQSRASPRSLHRKRNYIIAANVTVKAHTGHTKLPDLPRLMHIVPHSTSTTEPPVTSRVTISWGCCRPCGVPSILHLQNIDPGPVRTTRRSAVRNQLLCSISHSYATNDEIPTTPPPLIAVCCAVPCRHALCSAKYPHPVQRHAVETYSCLPGLQICEHYCIVTRYVTGARWTSFAKRAMWKISAVRHVCNAGFVVQ